MGIIECKNVRCVFYKKRPTFKAFVEKCTKRKIHIGQEGICMDFKVKNRAIETLERLKKKA